MTRSSIVRRVWTLVNLSIFAISICFPGCAYADLQRGIDPMKPMIVAAMDKHIANQDKSTTRVAKSSKHRHKPKHRWVSLGDCRITTYCPCCNDPAGYQSSSGKQLEEGMVACSWLENGTKLRIKGKVYTVMDYCGTDAIDIFIDTDICYCNTNCYVEVEIWK